MLPIKFCWNVIVATSFLPASYAGNAVYQEPVHFTRTSTSSSSESFTSTQSSTSTTAYSSFATDQPGAQVQSFPLSRDGVTCNYRFDGKSGAGKSDSLNAARSARPSRPLANLTPFDCHVQCPSRSSTAPKKRDCQKIVRAMKNAKKRSITIEPHTIFSVEYRECAIVFRNWSSQNVAVIYGWRRLIEQAESLYDQCSSASYRLDNSSGYQHQSNGVCFFASSDVAKSIQAYGSGKNSIGNSGISSGGTQNSGIIITFQRNKPSFK